MPKRRKRCAGCKQFECECTDSDGEQSKKLKPNPPAPGGGSGGTGGALDVQRSLNEIMAQMADMKNQSANTEKQLDTLIKGTSPKPAPVKPASDDEEEDEEVAAKAKNAILNLLAGGKAGDDGLYSKKVRPKKYPNILAFITRSTGVKPTFQNITFPEFISGFLAAIKKVEEGSSVYKTWFFHLQDMVRHCEVASWEKTQKLVDVIRQRVDAGIISLAKQEEVEREKTNFILNPTSAATAQVSSPSATYVPNNNYTAKNGKSHKYSSNNNNRAFVSDYIRPTAITKMYNNVQQSKNANKSVCTKWQSRNGCQEKDHHGAFMHVCQKCYDHNNLFSHPSYACKIPYV